MSYWCKNIDEALDQLLKAGYEYKVGRNQRRQVADVFIYSGADELYVELKAENSPQASFDRLMVVIKENATPSHWMAL